MLHRSTLLALLSCALLLPAAAAHAADPVVAGPLPDGTTATGRVVRGQLCLRIVVPQAPTRGPGPADDGSCDAVPVLGPLGYADGLASSSGAGTYDVGATGSDIAADELRRDGRVLAHAATQPSALPGAPDLRFYLLTTKETPDEVAFLDASGTVRRATDDSVDETGFGLARVPQTPRTTLVRGAGLHGGRWTLRAYATRPIVSTPLQPERRLTEPCLGLAWTAGGERGSGGTCDAPGRAAQQVLPDLVGDGCQTFGRYLGGLARARVARLVAVLGDGTRRAIALHALPVALGEPGLRAGLAFISQRRAVRSLIAYDAAGRVVETDPLGVAPSLPRRCDSQRETFVGGVDESLVTYSRGNPTALLGAGPHALQVADSGDQICFAADRAPRAPGDCTQPPVDPALTDVLSQPDAGGHFVFGIVPPEVATVRLMLDDGSRQDLPTTPIAGYAGQYAALLREVAGEVPDPRRAILFRLLDARGRTLASGSGPTYPVFGAPRTLGRVPGLGLLYYARAAVAPSFARLGALPSCVSVGRPARELTGQTCLPTEGSVFTITPSCRTRRTVVSVALAHAADRVSVLLASGRRVALRTLTLPAPYPRYEAVALAVGVLGPHDAPRTVIRRGVRPTRKTVALPPAAEQCGYALNDELDSPF